MRIYRKIYYNLGSMRQSGVEIKRMKSDDVFKSGSLSSFKWLMHHLNISFLLISTAVKVEYKELGNYVSEEREHQSQSDV